MSVILSSCQSGNSHLEKMPDIDLPLEDMNQDLHIMFEPNSNTFEMGDYIALIIYNTSDLPVVVGPDFGFHLFQKAEDQWEPVYEGTEDSIGNFWILANGSETRFQEFVTVTPEVYSQESVEIRIVMLGNYVKANGEVGKEVGAYIDVTLKPE